jgi:hypothetical protein
MSWHHISGDLNSNLACNVNIYDRTIKLPNCFLSKSVQNTICTLVCKVIPCRSVDSYHSFKAPYCLPLQGRRVGLPKHTASHPHDHFKNCVGDKGHSKSMFLISSECNDSENICDVHIHPTSTWKLVVSNNSLILSLVSLLTILFIGPRPVYIVLHWAN